MKTKNSRRYYLHSKVKKFTTINAHSKQVEVTDQLIESLTDKQRFYLDELMKFGYNLQYTII